MLNLNYNINPSSGPGNCRGEVKFNYSASIEATAGGGGGSDYLGTFPGGGGGAGSGYSTSISIIPNLTYQINVGGGGAANSKGQNTTFFGFDDNDTNPISLLLEGGFPGTPDNGGNSGTGSYTTVLGTTNLNSFSGSIRTSSTVQGQTFFLAGGGAGRNGNGVPPVLQFKSGDGGPGGGGGGGAARQASTSAVAGFGDGGGGNGGGTSGNATAGVNGGGGGGASTPGGGVVPAAGGNGVVIIRYAGQPKAFVTNATTVTADGFTTHTFNTGTGTFLYTYPYPWQDVVPYTVEVCPDEHNEDVRPPINWDFHSFASGSDNSDNPELGFATMSINAVNTNCIQVSIDSGNSFITDAQSQVTASITGSKWAVTGSTTMSLYGAGITYDPSSTNQFFFGAISASAAQIIATPNVTGSIITGSFLASEFTRWFISGSIVHTKGNIYNPKVNYKIDVTSPSASYVSSSFLITKDSPNVNVVSQIYTTSSNSGSVDYLYAFNMSASFSGAADYWASAENFKECTMSLSIPEIGKFQQSNKTNANLTASWVATDNNPYKITASIELKPWTPFPVEIIAIGGGGAGGGSNDRYNSGAGGGAGAVVSASWQIPVLTSFDIVIGNGGTCPTGSFSGSAGQDTTVYWNNVSSSILVAKGGSGGTTFGQSSGDGGSSGGTVGETGVVGAVVTNTIPANSTYALTPTGNVGNRGHIHRSDIPVPFSYLGGGGGGAVTAGQRGSAYNGGPGGSGINLSTFGLGTLAVGGDGGGYNTAPTKQTNGANAAANTGNGGGGANGGDGPSINVRGGNGGSGIVVIRYKGDQIATGGTVTQTLNYTTHTFTSNGTFTPTGNFQCCLPQPINIEYMVLGGGGGGTGGDVSKGGGAGGTLKTGTLPLPESGNTYPVVIGLGGATVLNSNGLQGGSSSIFGLTATGGTGGTILGVGGSNESYNGGTLYGGGGAGAGQNGSNGATPPPNTLAGNGGNGYTWIDGITYGPGGGGAYTQGGNRAPKSSNGSGIYGNGGEANFVSGSAGSSGAAVLRYNGNTQKATGGTITYNNGYVYHTFTSSADFNVQY